jgi:hypothetical protein
VPFIHIHFTNSNVFKNEDSSGSSHLRAIKTKE